MNAHNPYVVELLGISKSFGGIHALNNVTFQIKKGEVHALVGENGAGKSTLMKILSGAYQSDSGTIKINGKEVHISNASDARQLGVSIIYQELNLVPELTVAENLFLGDEISLKKICTSQKKLNREAEKIFEKIQFNIKPDAKVKDLSVGYMQMVEVAKAVSHNSEILVLDEPTAVLTNTESEKLFEVIRELKKQGKSIIYISHRMDEIMEMSDRVTVLKDGCLVWTKAIEEVTKDEIVISMIGREIGTLYKKSAHEIGDVVLEAKNLHRGKVVNGVSFSLRKGEILGFAGLIGAGKTETMRLLFGVDQKEEGEIWLNGKPVKINRPSQAIANGICYVSEDRKQEGVILDMSLRENITMSSIKEYTYPSGFLRHSKETKTVQERIQALNIKTAGSEADVSSLSGGNQQKVSLAKWVFLDGDVIILDEPTRGVDVGAKAEIYKIIADLAKKGKAVILVSSEMAEIINMCNRVLVMREGKISGELNGADITEENIIRLEV